MSKHSKWAKIKHQKGATDAKRGQVFTKLARNITIAGREGGGDVNFNFKLRLAVDLAKAANMPKDNIERAIEKGIGGGEAGALKELIYEAFGPAGSAFIILAYSDNVNRTAAEIKNILSKNGGAFAGQGSVIWQFQKLGILRFKAEGINREDLELMLIEAGAEDIKEEDGEIVVLSRPENFQKVKEVIDALKIVPESAAIEYVSKNEVELSSEDEAKAERLMEALDDDDDVSEIFTNIK